MRLLVLCKEVNAELCEEELINTVEKYLTNDALPANQMLTFRLLANMFVCAKGEALGLKSKEKILSMMSSSLPFKTKPIQVNV